MQALERLYYDYYSNHNISQNIYIGQRIRVYQNIYAILKDLNIKSLLDIGCSFGLLVDICNAQEINAVGLDLPIDSLKHFHQNLKYSANKFLYDSVDNGDNFDIFRDKAFDAITIIDSLRYFGHPEFIKKINATFIIIKEVSNNLYIRKYRKNAKIPGKSERRTIYGTSD